MKVSVLFGVLLAMLVGCTGHDDWRTSTFDSSGLLIVPQASRPKAPELAGESLNGDMVELTNFRGRVVFLNAFASWCPPCQQELPLLAKVNRTEPQVRIVGLDVMDHAPAARGVLQAVGATYPVISDPDGALLRRFTKSLGSGLPITIVIDEQGRVAGRVLGPMTEAMIKEALERLSAEVG